MYIHQFSKKRIVEDSKTLLVIVAVVAVVAIAGMVFLSEGKIVPPRDLTGQASIIVSGSDYPRVVVQCIGPNNDFLSLPLCKFGSDLLACCRKYWEGYEVTDAILTRFAE